jgi:hypothetical protein
MSKVTTQDRLAAKRPEAAFLHVLEKEFTPFPSFPENTNLYHKSQTACS